MANRAVHVPLFGGEDLVSSGISIAQGRAQLLWNYFCSNAGGYETVPGYVRYDGSTITLDYSDGDGTEPDADDIITVGAVSATVLAVVVSSGTWAGGDADGTITVEYVYGGSSAPGTGSATFSVAASSTCTVDSVASPAAVTGSGDIKGIWIWGDAVYAVRSDGAKDVMYKSSASGWSAADMGYSVAFTAGGGGVASPTPARGDTLTQGAVTATISGVSIDSGDFDTNGDAVGTLYVDTPSGGNFSAAAATYGSGADDVTLGGEETATVLGSGVRYEFRNHNFYAGSDTYLMYGVNGADQAFEYDGDALTFINSGVTADTPNHLAAHGQRLFLSYPGGGVSFSAPGTPTTSFAQDYTAGNLSFGQEAVGFQSLPGGVLALFGERDLKLLSGNISGSSGDMALNEYATGLGPREWTIQEAGDTVFLVDKGVTSVYQSDRSSGFSDAELSRDIDPLVRDIVGSEVASMVLRDKGVYRLFYESSATDSTEYVTATFASKRLIGWGRGDLGFTLKCVCSGRIGDEEMAFAGSDDGLVYRLERGRNWDGSDYTRALILPYNHVGDPLSDKRWLKTVLQVDASEAFDFGYACEFNYSQPGWANSGELTDQTKGGGAFWGLGIWDTFTWGAATYGTAELDSFGVGFNMALTISTTDDNVVDHNIRAFSSIVQPLRMVH